MATHPVILAFAGHDPSGGAGLQADIEALASQGCHAATVITTLTVQDTRDVSACRPLPAQEVIAQARAVLDDMPVAACKLGLLGSSDNARAIATLLAEYPGLPVVLDPVLGTGGGSPLADAELPATLCEQLLPLTTVVTPNSPEARRLAPAADTLADCAAALLQHGAGAVLVTGTHEDTALVENRFFSDDQVETFNWERLPHSYHGSGCTLAATLTGMLAHGLEPFEACHEAQEYTWNALRHGFRPGNGQHLPDRLFWSRAADD